MRQHSCLDRVPIFNKLDDKAIESITGLIHPSHYKKDEIIQQANSSNSRLLVLNRGRAKIVRVSADGKQQIVDWLKPGDFTGEISVFTEAASASEIVALEDTSFCTIDSSDLKSVMAASPDLALAVISELSQRLDTSYQQLESLGLMTAEQKIFNRLFELAGGLTTLKLPMAKKDLAAELGMSPETFSRNLASLAKDQKISLDGPRTITILSD